MTLCRFYEMAAIPSQIYFRLGDIFYTRNILSLGTTPGLAILGPYLANGRHLSLPF